ncbi:hypothetical protein Dimus_026335 [Dionaea muscipula]
MYKQSPSRNYRSKGIKVKHILQICLLLAVCFWLIYQVKRSHEKKIEFDAKEAKLVGDMERAGEIMKFGRKDLPRLQIVTKDDEENEVEEEEDRREEDEQDRDTKVDEREEDEEDLTRGGGIDEVEEHDLEKNEAETEHDEEFMDEEKGREEEVDERSEENEVEEKKSHSMSESLEEQDHDGATKNNHEAREELYKADDASSEVAQDTDTSSMPDRTDNLGILEQSKETKVSELGSSANETAAEEHKYTTTNSTGSLENNSSHPNSTLLVESTDQAEYPNKSAAVNAETTSLVLSNGTLSGEQSLSSTGDAVDSEEGQNMQAKTDDRNLAEAANTTEHVNREEKTANWNMTKDGFDEGQTKIRDKDEDGIANGSSDSQFGNETAESVSHDPIDISDSSIAEEEKEARMDLSTLPNIQDNVDDTDEAAEE